MTGRTHVILVNWNGAKDTVECLESLLRLEGEFTVTVCDNGSTDGSIDRITAWAEAFMPAPKWSCLVARLGQQRLRAPTYRRMRSGDPVSMDELPFLTILETGANLGFAGGNNAGIHLALADPDCAYIWLLNNDTVVDLHALTALLARMQDPDVAVCGSTLLYYDDPERIQALGARHLLFLARGEPIGAGLAVSELPQQAQVEADLDYVVGASLLVRRAVMERIGGLCEDYFLYFEELDLSRRLAVTEQLAWAPGSIVYHKEGGSIGTHSRGRASLTSLYYLRVNLLRFYRRYHPGLLPLAFVRVLRETIADIGHVASTKASVMAVVDFLFGRRRVGPIPASFRTRGE